MTEKSMQTLFGKYLEKNPPAQSEIYELKITKDKYISFARVQPHQIQALCRAEEYGLYHKISDIPVSWMMQTGTRFTAKKPFDCLMMVKSPAFIVFWFYKPRSKKMFIKIPIFKFLLEKNESKRKSLTEERAIEIGEVIEINEQL